MKRVAIILLVFLIVVWSSFIVWEMQITKWERTITGPATRVDLVLILPILIGITIYVIDQIITISKKK
ncbi:hypothetical protein ATE84_0622 [Aquimarina sp. MAR_2010_214]|uniref:hypothetical protein n=1 Tax=Aquimarina sp. MAR_2010_214 TaxID=1250026 RepID=UPI000C71230C|nr:hypothetical protein [Aquimarina sp. MAR_2010_214]PKV48619.1 hypothetical protein ATE84_0622 [Aquimarina sp. MAR_2010_214]